MMILRRRLMVSGAVTALILLTALGLELLWGGGSRPVSGQARGSYVLMIDAGHGGEDGGAVSVSGVPESGINLAIAEKTRWVAALCGVEPILLREEDVSLAEDSAVTLREKKRSDLEQRVKRVGEYPNGILLSIHQNKYPGSGCFGAQVFYRSDEVSRRWAEETQQALIDGLNPDNTRRARQIPKEIYLMNHVSCPAVLAECGFLSHPQEERLLRSEGYQRRIAVLLAGACVRCFGTGNP